jgi:hypothetical protein
MLLIGQRLAGSLERLLTRLCLSIPKIQSDMRRLCLDQPYSPARAIRLPVLLRAPALLLLLEADQLPLGRQLRTLNLPNHSYAARK